MDTFLALQKIKILRNVTLKFIFQFNNQVFRHKKSNRDKD